MGLVLLALALVVTLRTGEAEGQEGDGCAPTCVILIQVDGLEPKDVTPQTTPYLWQLAHSRSAAAQGSPSPGLSGRSGWIWQAPRGVVSTGTASSTASLITGAYPELSGIPADSFREGSSLQRLGAGGFGDVPAPGAGRDVAEPVGRPAVDALTDVMNDSGRRSAVFLGDPALAELVGATSSEIASPRWYPPGDESSATTAEDQFRGDPRLCPIPRYPDRGEDLPDQQDRQPPAQGYEPDHCPANDMTTMSKALSDLQATSGPVGFTFIHLAELGAAKRLAADPDVDADLPGTDEGAEPTRAPQPAQALSNLDTAVGSFVEQYAQGTTAAKWEKTVLMVVGSHGYQVTPVANRVPGPALTGGPGANEAAVADPTRDLSDFVYEYNRAGVTAKDLELVPQGTMASIYYTPAVLTPEGAAKRRLALQAIKAELEGTVNEACALRNPARPGCIRAVYYVDRADAPTEEEWLGKAHPTWRLDTRDLKTGVRTRASGDLVVVLEPGWAAGRAAGVPNQATFEAVPVTNPYTASAGGPQERAVAALVNGPALATDPGAVRDLDTFSGAQGLNDQVPYYPVSKTKVDLGTHDDPPPVPPPGDRKCPGTHVDPGASDGAGEVTAEDADFGGIACANHPEKVGDDANQDQDGADQPPDPRSTGHEAQPETVDFAVTISALMGLRFESPKQLQGRVLQEAFLNELSVPIETVEPEPPVCSDVAALTQSPEPATVEFRCTERAGAPMTYEVVSPPANGTLGPVHGATVRYTPNAGFSGTDTFTYRARSENGLSDIQTANVIVFEPPVVVRPPEYDFYGLLRGLKARVVDSRGHTWTQARRGSVLSTLRLQAEFGKPETAVTLTFYRQAPVNKRARGKGGRSARVVRLRPIARFDPFVVKRGQVTMSLKVPELFRPTYVGVTVREVARTPDGKRRLSGGQPCTTLKTLKRVRFRCTGASRSAIVRIADANRLHKRKATKPKRRPGRRR